MITLTINPTTVELPADLYWEDEHSWFPVEQTIERTITGALIVQNATRIGGRPITLRGEDERSAWINKATLDQLKTWASMPGQPMALSIRGQSKQVIFRHHDGEAIEATPVVHYAEMQDEDFYSVTIRLMEI